jgi:cytohesin
MPGVRFEAVDASGRTALRIAAQPGRERCGRRNLSAETALRERGAKTNIFIAALTGNLEELSAVTADDWSLINARDTDGATPLCLAAWNGQRTAVDWLLRNGADVEARDTQGFGPASVCGRPEAVDPQIIDMLLGHGAPMELRTALALGRVDAVSSLLRDDPALSNPDVQNWAVENITDTALVKLLFSAGAPLSLFQAASLGETQTVSQYLEKEPAALHRRDSRRETALHHAAARGNKETVELLLARGASPDAAGGDGGTPLHRAAKNGQPEIVMLLLAGGADVSRTNFRGETPVFDALNGGDTRSLMILLENGASVGTVATGKSTPLHLAAEIGDAAAARLLIERGADLQATNYWGAAPLHLATREGHTDIVSPASRSRCRQNGPRQLVPNPTASGGLVRTNGGRGNTAVCRCLHFRTRLRLFDTPSHCRSRWAGSRRRTFDRERSRCQLSNGLQAHAPS